MASSDLPNDKKKAWTTVLTRSSYLAGVLILAYTLQRQKSKYPLIVLVTPTLDSSSVRALELEAKQNPLLIIHHVEMLYPVHNRREEDLIAARFADTWTKLRVFEMTEYETIVCLDADMAVFRNLDDIFDIELPGRDWLAANHACVCNLDGDHFAPSDWKPENCAYTPLSHPTALTKPTPVPKSADSTGKHTHRLLNSGMFVFHPSEAQWKSLLHELNTSDKCLTYDFPDQDFLDDFFRDRWFSIGWQYNALKTMRYWHESLWRDDEVRVLHYIVDKPWQRRIASDGVAGHLGRDGVTHRWWWGLWDAWVEERRVGQSGEELVGSGERVVAGVLDEEADAKQAKENMEKGLPIQVPAHPGIVEGAWRKESEKKMV
ncbi:hypothetical protein MMC25_000599 [Agyrium rufum]|nr:hypothetical protein [Agyrium rufum]